jgi:hypothetical protein
MAKGVDELGHMVRTFWRREGGECFPAEDQLTRLIYRSEKPLWGSAASVP